MLASAAGAGGPTWVRLAVAAVAGLVVGVALSFPMTWQYGLLLGWVSAAAVFVVWTWVTVWPMNPAATARHAVQEDPGRAATDLIILAAAVVSLGAVGLLLLGGSSAGGGKDMQAGVSVLGVAFAWAAVHTTFTTRYARLYYTTPKGGIDFNEDDPPRYRDFAYFAFTIGMTFQVSDTEIRTKEIRATVLRHALLSYLFGVVVIAATINLVAGLSK
ncbi:DUF1345 domain-containing protein [Nostocoides sp. HKS02]|nr:DUF1345 domain-containing protein [Tetrasphaera sp. HKS02]